MAQGFSPCILFSPPPATTLGGMPSKPWTAAEVALLGTLPDAKLGKRLGRSWKSVQWKRRKLKIPLQHKDRNWSAAEIAMLGIETDDRVAKLAGRTVSGILSKRSRLGIRMAKSMRRPRPGPKWKWGPTELHLFQTYSDAEIAKLTCRPLAEVVAKRTALAGA
jgi:hypothetical protein